MRRDQVPAALYTGASAVSGAHANEISLQQHLRRATLLRYVPAHETTTLSASNR